MGEKKPELKRCRHERWAYEGFSCSSYCYTIRCVVCKKVGKARYLKGEKPRIGDIVRLLGDQDTIEKIGSRID